MLGWLESFPGVEVVVIIPGSWKNCQRMCSGSAVIALNRLSSATSASASAPGAKGGRKPVLHILNKDEKYNRFPRLNLTGNLYIGPSMYLHLVANCPSQCLVEEDSFEMLKKGACVDGLWCFV